MVVGIRRTLEPGRIYTIHELSLMFGMEGADLDHVVDYLMGEGCLKPVMFDRQWHDGRITLTCANTGDKIKWQAA